MKKLRILQLISILSLMFISGCGSSSSSSSNLADLSLPQSLNIEAGGASILMASISNNTSSPIAVSFNSNNGNVAIVDTSCTIPAGATSCAVPVKGLSLGDSTVVASAIGYSKASTTVVVITSPTISLLPNPLNVAISSNAKLTALVESAVLSPLEVTFVSDNGNIATVNSSCTIPSQSNSCVVDVQGLGSGTTSVSASAPGYVLATSLKVNVVSDPILTLSPSSSHVASGGKIPITAYVGGKVESPLLINFGSSNDNIATVDNSCIIPIGANSCVVAVYGAFLNEESVASISAIASGYMSSNAAVIKVEQAQTLVLSPGTFKVASGNEARLTVSVETAIVSPVLVSFGTSNSSVVNVDNSCTIPAGATSCVVAVYSSLLTEESSASISASSPGYILSGAAEVTVEQEPTLTLSPSSLSITSGSRASLTASVESLVS